MTFKQSNKLIIQQQAPAICELCSTHAELRPYGPNGENICFDCGMKSIETTNAAFDKILDESDQVFLIPPNGEN